MEFARVKFIDEKPPSVNGWIGSAVSSASGLRIGCCRSVRTAPSGSRIPTDRLIMTTCFATPGGREATAAKITVALEEAGIRFIDANGGGPGVRLRKLPKHKS